ncbi:MAG: hypothetical protein LC742_08780 [Acidobacteria bacterium]|nr:hypothetical protein [Acidobacteriota bacterium]
MSSALKAKIHSLAVVEAHAPPDVMRQEYSASSVCSRCHGTGMEVVPGKGARRCECRKQDDRAKLLEAARIPARYRECSLSNYHPAPGNGSQLQAFTYAFKLADEYPAVERGLLLTGTVGVGKTHPSNYPCRADSCAARDGHGY